MQVTASTLTGAVFRLSTPGVAPRADTPPFGIGIHKLASRDLPSTVGVQGFAQLSLGLAYTCSLLPNDPSSEGAIDLMYANLTDVSWEFWMER